MWHSTPQPISHMCHVWCGPSQEPQWGDFLATSRLLLGAGTPAAALARPKRQEECAWPAGERKACRTPHKASAGRTPAKQSPVGPVAGLEDTADMPPPSIDAGPLTLRPFREADIAWVCQVSQDPAVQRNLAE